MPCNLVIVWITSSPRITMVFVSTLKIGKQSICHRRGKENLGKVWSFPSRWAKARNLVRFWTREIIESCFEIRKTTAEYIQWNYFRCESLHILWNLVKVILKNSSLVSVYFVKVKETNQWTTKMIDFILIDKKDCSQWQI